MRGSRCRRQPTAHVLASDLAPVKLTAGDRNGNGGAVTKCTRTAFDSPRSVGPELDRMYYKKRSELRDRQRTASGARWANYGDPGRLGSTTDFNYLLWNLPRSAPGVLPGGGIVEAVLVQGQPVQLCDVPGLSLPSFDARGIRTVNDKSLVQDFYNYSDLGVKGLYYPEGWKYYVRLNVQGAFTQDVSAPGVTNSMVEQFSEDLSVVRGGHQIGLGANFIHSNMNYTSGTWTSGRFSFNGTNTGLSLADLMVGRPNEWRQDQIAAQ